MGIEHLPLTPVDIQRAATRRVAELRVQVKAVWQSLDEKWLPIYQGKALDRGVSNCACCQQFRIDSDGIDTGCDGCPIFEDTGQITCGGTPYARFAARNAIVRTNTFPMSGPKERSRDYMYREYAYQEYEYLAQLALNLTEDLWLAEQLWEAN